jgi:RND family efflux transporter MFP subunit
MMVVLMLAGIIAVSLVVFRPKAQRQARTEPGYRVETISAESTSVPMIIETYGTVKASNIVKMYSEIRGKVVGTHPDFEEGRRFSKGTILIEIDPRVYELEAERQRASEKEVQADLERLEQEVKNLEIDIGIARADLNLADADFQRVKSLFDRKVVSQNAVDKAEHNLLLARQRLQVYENQYALTAPKRKQLEAKIQLTRILLKQANLDLEKTAIVAPFDGWVLEKTVERGQLVNVGGFMGSVYEEGAMEVDIAITSSDLFWLQTTDLSQKPLPVKVIYGQGSNRMTWEGRLVRFLAVIDENTRTFPAIVKIDEVQNNMTHQAFLLKPGMFVTVRITGKLVENVFILPRQVVHENNILHVVEENRLRLRSVHVLRYFKESVYIDKGLSNGDKVIITAVSAAYDGMIVRTK